MNKIYTSDDDFSAISLNKNKFRQKNLLFDFLVFNTFVMLFLLITILKPPKLYKKFIIKFFSFSFKIKDVIIKIYHILFFIIGLYISLYFFLKKESYKIIPPASETYVQKMQRLDKKWVVESEIWMTFLIIICLISIYRNAHLFNKEIQAEEKIKEIEEEIMKNKDKKTS